MELGGSIADKRAGGSSAATRICLASYWAPFDRQVLVG